MQKQQYLYKAVDHTANLNNMRLQDKWCDVTIKVNGMEIRGHKVILAANLKYFDAAFSNDSFQESKEGVISMESINETDLEAFVSYAYTGEILLTDSNALNLLELANYLGEEGIKTACIEFLEKHLKTEEACRAYKFADSVGCLPLKNAAKKIIMTNFEDCSKHVDYLDFDCECLTDILSHAKAEIVKLQQTFFEGIMRWIIHDAKERKVHLEKLLGSIDISKLTADDLLDYFYKNSEDLEDEYGIMKYTLRHYKTSSIESKFPKNKIKRELMIAYTTNSKLFFQFYNFLQKKWSSLQEISVSIGNIFPYSAVLNDKLYFVSEGSGENHLHVFDPKTKQITTSHSSSSILELNALAACSRYIYLCGGETKNNSISNQVLRYDPETNSLQALIPMATKRNCAAAIFYQGCVYVLGGLSSSSHRLNLVEKYNPDTNTWTALAPMKTRRHCFGVTVLDNKLYACGDYPHGNSAEVYDPTTDSWQPVAHMNRGRSQFLTIANEGKLLAIGGKTDKSLEVYDPSTNQWQIDSELSSGLQVGSQIDHLFGGLISSSCITDT